MRDSGAEIADAKSNYYIEIGSDNSIEISQTTNIATLANNETVSIFAQGEIGKQLIHLQALAESFSTATATLTDEVTFIATAFSSAFSQAFK